MSHPSRVRGLKFRHTSGTEYRIRVAPFTGAWIEITTTVAARAAAAVAPFTGAWIGISPLGLGTTTVTFTGAWIEIPDLR